MTGANFNSTTYYGLTKEQLYSTASYQQKNLRGIRLGTEGGFGDAPNGGNPDNDLTGWDLSGQDLTNAFFFGSTLTGTKFDRATVNGTSFSGATSHGLTKEQVYSTASYRQKNLQGIQLGGNDLTGWDLNSQDLSNAHLESTLMNINMTGAIVTGANLSGAKGLTKEQFYSTASYQQKNLQGIGLRGNDLTGWDLSTQDLTNANFQKSTLLGTNLAGAFLSGADFSDTTSHGFTKEQLYSTASYQEKNLQRVNLDGNDLSGWNLRGQDLRGSIIGGGSQAILRNAIRAFGEVDGLDLTDGEQLIVRNFRINDSNLGPTRTGIIVYKQMMIGELGKLTMILAPTVWQSTIYIQPDIAVLLDGTLELDFAPDVNLQSQVGRTIKLFAWSGVSPTGTFAVESPYTWDLSHLYTSGEVTLLAIPEPTNIALIYVSILGALRRPLRLH